MKEKLSREKNLSRAKIFELGKKIRVKEKNLCWGKKILSREKNFESRKKFQVEKTNSSWGKK